jgi:hypothetical protein
MRLFLALAAALNLLSVVSHLFLTRYFLAPRFYQQGFEDGRKSADNWWIGLEQDVDQWQKEEK